ncbi:hypothetical protein CEXT_99291 [Caerostris extrusa]|uniref:Uncharacterized protein n=1 Tax=Caerostris extrusa TaxID=172846 RepID=A0AAV4XGH1_CAEEX|nr:hypothetical protein CEXT_99291 [Caerostris extrusa]
MIGRTSKKKKKTSARALNHNLASLSPTPPFIFHLQGLQIARPGSLGTDAPIKIYLSTRHCASTLAALPPGSLPSGVGALLKEGFPFRGRGFLCGHEQHLDCKKEEHTLARARRQLLLTDSDTDRMP